MNETQLAYLRMLLSEPSNEPMYKRLAVALIEMIEKKEILADEKLPAIRALAESLSVNRSTVIQAYKWLEIKKATYSIVGSGTYVADLKITGAEMAFEPKRQPVEEALFVPDGAINFANASTSTELFPVAEFKGLFNAVLDRDKGNAFGYEDSQGYAPLREALSAYLARVSIGVSAENIQIISGAQQGLDIVAKAALSHGDTVLVETPTYYGAVGSFQSRGASVIGVPILADGLDVGRLEALVKVHKPKLLYVMPYFQTPTCISYSLEKKRAILELAAKYDFYIVEEDNQSDFLLAGSAVPMKALDYKNRVIYIKSFSKILMPGLRLGFMVLPKAILNKAASIKYMTDVETSGFIQRAFDLFIRNGQWEQHIVKMRNIYAKRHDQMKISSAIYLKNKLQYTVPKGGLNFWYTVPEIIDVSALCNVLLKRGVIVTPGTVFSLNHEPLPNMRLSFAHVDEMSVKRGLQLIGTILEEWETFR